MFDELASALPFLSTTATIVVTLGATAHALLRKRDVRAAIGWVGVIWLVPILGVVLYALLGVNRIQRRAVALRAETRRYHLPPFVEALGAAGIGPSLSGGSAYLVELTRVVDRVTRRPLLPGNHVTPLVNGDEAYPAMLQAIDGAQSSVSLSTYIFDNDHVGKRFADALARAVRRGVEVRVLIDDAGLRYSRPPIHRSLRAEGVRVARFLPAFLPWRAMYFNLRNHRKILVVDGRVGFTGGMNIRQGHLIGEQPAHPVADLHFQVEGPVVGHFQEAFAEDWEFTTRESLSGARWFPPLHPVGSTLARGIVDGPDQDFEKVRWTFVGALCCARRSIRIVTPYFLPDQSLITALNAAAMRGITVDILIPARSNLPMVHWAMWAQIGQVIDRGCRVWLTPPPFDHTKLVLVDDEWSLFGSANWDPRSLRLNFEFDVECYDRALASRLAAIVHTKIESATRLNRKDLTARGLLVRLRDAVAWLFMPYL